MHVLSQFVVLALSAAVFATPADAQVSVDLHALEALPATNAPVQRPKPRPVRPKVTLPATAGPPVATVQPPPAAPAPELPTAAPPVAVPPVASPQVAPPPAASTDPMPARTAAAQPPAEAPKRANLRIAFGPDQTELSKDNAAALQALLQSAYASGAPAFTIVGYAAGRQDDPSSARRLSLARAMATRTALMNEGVPSRRITVRALGSQAGDGPADRVDVGAAPATTP